MARTKTTASTKDTSTANPPFNDSYWFHKDDGARLRFGVPLGVNRHI